MTKSEIVKEISARTGIDGKAVLAVVEGFMNEVKTSLGKEENVYLRGFGSFIVHISVIPTQAFRSYPPSLFPIKWHWVANL